MINRQTINLLLVGDDLNSTTIVKNQLVFRGYDVHHVLKEQDFITRILKKDIPIDLIILINTGDKDKYFIAENVLNSIKLPLLFIGSFTDKDNFLLDIDTKIENSILSFKNDPKNDSSDDLLEAFALHEIICDENGIPINYRFLDADKKFLKRIGKSKEELIGKTVLDLYPNTENVWIETFGRVALSRKPEVVVFYSVEFDNYYEARIYSPEKGQFAALFIDTKKTQGKYVCK